MPSRRCSICGLDWPLKDDYKKCPSCLEKTDKVRNIAAMDDSEAKSLKANFDFERYYEKWDAEKPPQRLIPEVAGSSHSGTDFASIHRPEKPA